MKTDSKSTLDALTDQIKVTKEFNSLYQNNYGKVLVWLPVLSMLITIISGIMKHGSVINSARQAVIITVLTYAVIYYIKISAESILIKEYAKTVIMVSYLCSVILLLFIPQPEILCFWMVGGLVIAMIIDNKLGLITQFNMAVIIGITLEAEPKLLFQIMIVSILMSILADALKNKSTILYGIIIILSIHITIAYVINKFAFDKITGVGDYYFSILSILSVITVACFVFYFYMKILNKKNLVQASQNHVFENIIHSEEENDLQKNDLQKNDLQKNDLHKNELQKNELQNNDLQKNDLHKNNLLENDLSNNDLIDNKCTKIKRSKNKIKNQTDEYSSKSDNLNTVKADNFDTASDITYQAFENLNSIEPEIGTSYEVLCNLDNTLLKDLKEYSEELYNHSLKIADLSSRAAKIIDADELLAKVGGLYHEIGRIKGPQYIEEGLKIAEEYAFPNKLTAILKEHNIKYDKPNSLEAAIVMLSDNVVSTIEYIEKQGNRRLTSDKVIDTIFQSRMDKGTFDCSGMSLKDFKALKEFYINEYGTGEHS